MAVIPVPISKEWLIGKAVECSSSGQVAILIEGYPATGFGVVSKKGIEWRLSPREAVPTDWSRFADLRLFGDRGEWHCWNDGAGWHGRFASEWKQTLPRQYAIWGNPVPDNGWWRCHETRGATVWVPASLLPPAPPKPDALFLHALLLVEHEPGTGLAGITDFRVCGFSWGER
jgi:CRISPR-associated protein (TIGR03984 family)